MGNGELDSPLPLCDLASQVFVSKPMGSMHGRMLEKFEKSIEHENLR